MKLKKKKAHNETRIKEKCGHEKCNRRARAKHECLTCEKLVNAGKAEEVFVSAACGEHAEWGLENIKRHALTAHPVNIIKGVVSQLKGEDVF